MSTTRSKSKPSTIEECNLEKDVSLAQVVNMLTQIDSTLKKLVKGQDALETRLTSLEEQLRNQEKTLKTFEESLKFNDAELTELKSSFEKAHNENEGEKIRNREYHEQRVKLQLHLENLEKYSRSFNIRFVGIPESTDGPYEDCITKITELIKTQTGITADIENAHRTGRKGTGKPRHIIAKFLKVLERFTVCGH